jgi:hypothetical protein
MTCSLSTIVTLLSNMANNLPLIAPTTPPPTPHDALPRLLHHHGGAGHVPGQPAAADDRPVRDRDDGDLRAAGHRVHGHAARHGLLRGGGLRHRAAGGRAPRHRQLRVRRRARAVHAVSGQAGELVPRVVHHSRGGRGGGFHAEALRICGMCIKVSVELGSECSCQ